MPVTKTAQRAFRSSKRKEKLNKSFSERLEIAMRNARKIKSAETISEAVSLIDRAVKKNILHKNKAARMKSKVMALNPKPSKKKIKK